MNSVIHSHICDTFLCIFKKKQFLNHNNDIEIYINNDIFIDINI